MIIPSQNLKLETIDLVAQRQMSIYKNLIKHRLILFQRRVPKNNMRKSNVMAICIVYQGAFFDESARHLDNYVL